MDEWLEGDDVLRWTEGKQTHISCMLSCDGPVCVKVVKCCADV